MKFPSSLVFQSLSLQVEDDFPSSPTLGLELCLWTTADYFSPTPQAWLILIWPSSPPTNNVNFMKAFTCVFDAMSLPFLTHLWASTINYIDALTWIKAFIKLPLLEWVSMRSYATHRFLEALVYKTQTAEKLKTAYRNVLLPKLHYICLEGTNFDATILGSISVDKLLDYLMERCERDAEVQVLCLDGCYYISSDDVARLKEIVVDVIWDGVEREVSQYESEDERLWWWWKFL